MVGAAASATFRSALRRGQARLARLTWTWLVLYVVLTSAPLIYVDYAYPMTIWPVVLLVIFAWASGYMLLFAMMESVGVSVESGIGSFFAIGLVTSVAIAIASAAFVLPGVYLVLRWLPAYVRGLATDGSVAGSLGWSWSRTKPFQKELALGLVGPVVLLFPAGLFTFEHLRIDSDPVYLAFLVGIHLTQSAGCAWLLLLGVASYLAIGSTDEAEAPAEGAAD